MADKLVTCSACGTKNVSHRTVCLKCGVSLSSRQPEEEAIRFMRESWQNSESMSREIAEVLDSEVKSLSDSPNLSTNAQEAAKYLSNKFENDRQLIITRLRDLNKTKDYQNLDDIPIELAEAIRAVWRQAEAFASSGDPISSGLMPEKVGDLLRDLICITSAPSAFK